MKKAFTITLILFWLLIAGIFVMGLIQGPEETPTSARVL
jgi:hypothetical protein